MVVVAVVVGDGSSVISSCGYGSSGSSSSSGVSRECKWWW